MPFYSVNESALMIRKGDVVAYPTEAVWGLGCDPKDEEAVGKILSLKCRPVEKGLILAFSDVAQVESMLPIDERKRQLLTEDRDRATTFIVPCDQRVPFWIKGRHKSVAIRISKHPTVTALCEALGHGIVSTSANPAGQSEATTAQAVRDYFGASLPLCEGSVGDDPRPSQIIDIVSGAVIRS